MSMYTHQRGWKIRGGPAGVHAFHRQTGLNVLMDEIDVPVSLHARAPRQVSIALTNRCDLTCVHCYAPKSHDSLPYESLKRWLVELDSNGALGVGFGGGEPTLYRQFSELCHFVTSQTGMAVSLTTHGHHFGSERAEELRGAVNFVRVSMDGAGDVYESIRGRRFSKLVENLAHVRSVARFGINVVINHLTMPCLDDVARVAADTGACDLLLLPQVATHRVSGIRSIILQELRGWVETYRGTLRLSMSEGYTEGFPVCDPLTLESGLAGYAHIDARGQLKASSYAGTGIPIGDGTVLEAVDHLAESLKEASA